YSKTRQAKSGVGAAMVGGHNSTRWKFWKKTRIEDSWICLRNESAAGNESCRRCFTSAEFRKNHSILEYSLSRISRKEFHSQCFSDSQTRNSKKIPLRYRQTPAPGVWGATPLRYRNPEYSEFRNSKNGWWIKL